MTEIDQRLAGKVGDRNYPIVGENPLDLSPTQFLNELGGILLERRRRDLRYLSAEEQHSMLAARTVEIGPNEELLEKLRKSKEAGQPLMVVFGIDPTGSDVHLGHAMPMIIANRLQRMGHKIVIIIGDFTAQIGDPSERDTARKALSREQITANLATYRQQMAPIFDLSTATIRYNSEWLGELNAYDLFALFSHISVSKLIQSSKLKERLKTGQPITLAEINYPALMAADAAFIGADVQIGGVDQTLNLYMGRNYMAQVGLPPQSIITTPLIPGTDGVQKMSKSLENYIALNESPSTIYGKIMSIPDKLMEIYFKGLTEVIDKEWETLQQAMESRAINPMDVKKMLARIVTAMLYDANSAQQAQNQFELIHQAKKIGDLDIDSFRVLFIDRGKVSVVNILVDAGLASSKSEARRLIEQRAVRILVLGEEEKITVTNLYFDFTNFNGAPIVLQKGTRQFIRLNLQ